MTSFEESTFKYLGFFHNSEAQVADIARDLIKLPSYRDNRHAKRDVSITPAGIFSYPQGCFRSVPFSFCLLPLTNPVALASTNQVTLIAGSHDMSPLLKSFVKAKQRG